MNSSVLTSNIIEVAVAKMFDYRAKLIVPNVSFGFNLNYEVDMVVVSGAGYAYQVEIKISAADFRKDIRKSKFRLRSDIKFDWRHTTKVFREFYYAMPYSLYETIKSEIDISFGVIVIRELPNGRIVATKERRSKINDNAYPISNDQYSKLDHLGCMRIWNLKSIIIEKNKGYARTRKGL